MKKTSIALAVFAVVLFAVQASAQTSQIELPSTHATSFVRISASMLGTSGAPAPITFAGKMGVDKSCGYRRFLMSAPFSTDTCRSVSFNVDLRTLVRSSDPHALECLQATATLVDAATGDTVAGCTRSFTGYAFKLDNANTDTTTSAHYTFTLPPRAPANVQLKLAVSSFLMPRRPIVTTTAIDGTVRRSSIQMQ